MNKYKNLLIILGTRPEAIKLAPLILNLRSEKYNVVVCNTEQQKELSNQALSFFGQKADINLSVMTTDQTLFALQSNLLLKLKDVLANRNFDGVLVQGDTMSAFCGALAGFYAKVPVFHIEAGLRSGDLYEPFPEEALREMISKITALHFAPTIFAKETLIKENIAEDKIIVSGNTGIDALNSLPENVMEKALSDLRSNKIEINDRLVLITVHRRENHGDRLQNILKAISELVNIFKDHTFVLPVHPNPNVRQNVHNALNSYNNVRLLDPVDYPVLVTLMKNSKLILTDSGGIQEEAPSFGVPLLVLRYATERSEGVEAGVAKLVGAEYRKILDESSYILERDKSLTRNKVQNPYGDGEASIRIVKSINKFFI
ncbi:MAG: UDP-N-acetylglucosamine 2-epimerase (non-hydrolyzing) [Endomicrobium sp.]|jgi:UDP-N-acetylglucosamine 2-epimerase (non-hydrolysing)|uniref:non-hydrolyzing UDP-N-acetylglucosamine 2-epimerase n=1 Tax=Candidatus Endomicrobiellum cubanum TaxID=3242325 RepID=UPI0028338DC8|nr:UDP-N-acetylglucosamine 2-epimerase (non-hydrolyzing) [Endomicrobium sp.]